MIEYLVDCNGYSEEQDLQHLKKEELKDLVVDWDECEAFVGGRS